MESKVCSRSHGHPPGARSRSMIATARSNRSPVADIPPNLNEPDGGRKAWIPIPPDLCYCRLASASGAQVLLSAARGLTASSLLSDNNSKVCGGHPCDCPLFPFLYLGFCWQPCPHPPRQ